MRISCIIVILVMSSSVLAQTGLDLMPYPSNVRLIGEKFRIRKEFKIGVVNGTRRLYDGSTRFLRRLDNRVGLFFKQNFIGVNDADESASLLVSIERPGELQLNEDETYQLDVKESQITIDAETDIGALRGLATLQQLLKVDEQGYYFPGVDIDDEPRFPWRGLLIDVSRHWMPVDVIKRNLDGMAAVKMNVLHLHLTDDQGFRIESKIYPKLHESGSNGDYYTQDQIGEIIDHAAARGIRVVPEFDIPGHTASWFVGYPELASAPGPYEIETSFGVQDPTMNPVPESTYQFLDKFLGEMAELFPDDYIHIGGDENNGNQWDVNKEIQSFMAEMNFLDNNELQSYFNDQVLDILGKHGKQMMGWDEIFQPGISREILIQSWRGRDALVEAATQGYFTILSNGYYLDLCQPAYYHYLNDPLPEGTPLSPNETRYILGGEAAMWSEIITRETIDSRIWPRTAAIAERLWSPGAMKNVEDMYRRMEIISIQLEELGLQHNKNYEMILRRLAGGNDIAALKKLVDVIEPLEGYARQDEIEFTTYAPFTRLADAAQPESKTAREFSQFVERYIEIGDRELIQEMKDYLLPWAMNHRQFVELSDRSPILRDANSLSLDLSNIAKIGLQSLSNTVNHSQQWKTEAKKMLNAAREPRMECELVIISPIEKLVDASN